MGPFVWQFNLLHGRTTNLQSAKNASGQFDTPSQKKGGCKSITQELVSSSEPKEFSADIKPTKNRIKCFFGQ